MKRVRYLDRVHSQKSTGKLRGRVPKSAVRHRTRVVTGP